MNKKYRNPFASNPEEIGQEDVPVEDIVESALRNYIRALLIESNDATVKQEAKSLVNMLFSEIEKFWNANNSTWYQGYKKEDYEKDFLNVVWHSLLDGLGYKGNPYPFRADSHSLVFERTMFNAKQLEFMKGLEQAQQKVVEYEDAVAKTKTIAAQVADKLESALKQDSRLDSAFFVALHNEYEKRGMNITGYFGMQTSSPHDEVRAYKTHLRSYSEKSRRERQEEEEFESRLSTDQYLDYID